MGRCAAWLAGSLMLLGTGAGAVAGDAPGMTVLPDDAAVHWGPSPPSLPSSTQISILSGDPAQPGPFTLRLRMPAGTVIAPHTHATAENLTVLSGAIVHDMGETMDKARGRPLAAGGFVFLPGDMPHSLWTTTEAAEIQVSGTGPFGLHYINPADDPGQAR